MRVSGVWGFRRGNFEELVRKARSPVNGSPQKCLLLFRVLVFGAFSVTNKNRLTRLIGTAGKMIGLEQSQLNDICIEG